jgi:NAD(P)-dependent dehydrogenase (short-subunit alcohol dehydrogenase family)
MRSAKLMKGNVFITGADRGLGFALAKKFLKEGYIVYAGSYLTDWHELPGLKQENPDKLHVINLDISDDESVLQAAETLGKHTDKLDILINNAGIFLFKYSGTIFEEQNYDDMIRMYNVNALGPMRVTKALLPFILRGDKKIIACVSSEAGSVGACWRVKDYGYSMSKSALNMQCAILQNHMKEYGVKVLALHPGWVRSYMSGVLNTEAEVEPDDSADGLYKVIHENTDINGPMYIDYQGKLLPW